MILQNSKLIDDLVFIANGDIELVERAVVASAGTNDRADLKDVVAYIVRNSSPSPSRSMSETTLPQMLLQLRSHLDMNQKQLAEALDCSSQFICDMERGHRTPSVAFVDKICDYLSRGPKGRREWHVAAARAHGWKV